MEVTWLNKLADGLRVKLGPEKTEEILRESEHFETFSETERAEWCAQMAKRMDGLVRDEVTKIEIMSTCSCRCYEEHLTYLKEVYQGTGDINTLLSAMHRTVFRVKPIREGNKILITKAPAQPEKYAKATTPEKKREYFCHCDNVRSYNKEISPTYCYCGAGWCKNIWEEVLGKKVRIEITQSVLQGDEVCQFAVYI